MLEEYTDAGQRFSDCLSALSNEADKAEEKHVRSVTETDDSYIVEFEKDLDDSEEDEEE